jgi:hypothetical protein
MDGLTSLQCLEIRSTLVAECVESRYQPTVR